MKTSSLLLGSAITAFTLASFASEPLLSPRAAGNQIKLISEQSTPTITITCVDAPSALLSPRAASNQIKVVKGTANDTNAVLVCRETMKGSPKAVAECSSHANMPGCVATTH